MSMIQFFPYLIVSAGVTYLVRMLPMVLMRRKIENKFILSFLYYMPYSVLTVMTVPGIFYASASAASAAAGFAAAVVLAFLDQGLLRVAAASCAAVFIFELIAAYVQI